MKFILANYHRKSDNIQYAKNICKSSLVGFYFWEFTDHKYEAQRLSLKEARKILRKENSFFDSFNLKGDLFIIKVLPNV